MKKFFSKIINAIFSSKQSKNQFVEITYVPKEIWYLYEEAEIVK